MTDARSAAIAKTPAVIRGSTNSVRPASRRAEARGSMHGRAPGLGNQATQALLRSHAIQAKLSVSPPDDPLEREADAVAARVMGGRSSGGALVQRKCAACEPEELQRKAGSDSLERVDGALARQIDSLRGGGAPLSDSARGFFEPRFGQDFGAVRIHSDARAAETARSINALAFTRGQDIAFAQGRYQPESFTGRKLLAHELAHVVQQSEGVRRWPADGSEQETCDPADLRDWEGCEMSPPVFEPDGVLVKFDVNCFELSTDVEMAKVRNFADSLQVGDKVRVHGYASTDGDPGFNQRISCARANYVADFLTKLRYPSRLVTVIAHGATQGPANERRSAVLALEQPASRQPTPQLRTSVEQAPVPGSCGDVDYQITWHISRPAHPQNGGYVIQQLWIRHRVSDCDGKPVRWIVENPRREMPRTLMYYEAWRVNPGGTEFHQADGNRDTFKYENSPPCTTGFEKTSGQAIYYDNVADLPREMKRRNRDTLADDLKSSILDPNLLGRGGIPSRPVSHNMTIQWNCCPCQESLTNVVTYTPS